MAGGAGAGGSRLVAGVRACGLVRVLRYAGLPTARCAGRASIGPSSGMPMAVQPAR